MSQTPNTPSLKLSPLPESVPALRVELRGRTIIEASAALGAILGVNPHDLVGQPFEDLFVLPERVAIHRRLDDIVLLGRDSFGAVALCDADGSTVLTEVNAHYIYKGGQRVEMALRRLNRPVGAYAPATYQNGHDSTDEHGAPIEQFVAEGPPPDAAGIRPESAQAEEARDGPAHEGEALDEAQTDEARTDEVQAAALGDEVASERAHADEPQATEIGTDTELEMPVAMACLQAAGAAAVALDADGAITSATPEAERVTGRPIARLIGHCFEDLVTLPETAAEAWEAARSARSRQSVLGEMGDGGGQVVLEWVPGPEAPRGFVVLTAAGKSAADSSAADNARMLARLVSFVAHDVRESLSAVYYGLHNVVHALDEGTQARQAAEAALRDSDRANRIIKDVLLVSRPGTLNKMRFDLVTLVREVTERFDRKGESKGVSVTAAMPDSYEINADLNQLERMLTNLLENALQATESGGSVTVTAVTEDRGRPGIRLDVSDTGSGIPAHLQPNIFEPFVTNKAEGTGLGLAMTRRTVLDHEGHIDLESQEGQGTTFHIWLPEDDDPRRGS